jgi:tetratricopeptide (TPR) repeat protein
VYVLAHEELQMAAVSSLGLARLTGYHERLHTWAEAYRQRGWPSQTPAYLLRGYYRMLCDTADIPRLVACATDKARHDRMFDVTGGGALALSEIATAQDVVLRQGNEDQSILARLTTHQRELADRNTNIPTELPAVLASLGELDWGVALARSIVGPDRRALALAALAEAAAAAGDLDRAEELAERAEEAVRAITSPDQQASALVALVHAMARVQDPDRAEALARSITGPDRQAPALAALAEAAAAAGDLDRAEELARSITDLSRQAQVLTTLAKTVRDASDHRRAITLADSAVVVARTITHPV